MRAAALIVFLVCLPGWLLAQDKEPPKDKDKGGAQAKPEPAKPKPKADPAEDWGKKSEDKPFPLTEERSKGGGKAPAADGSFLGLLLRVALYLALVLGLLFATAWLVKRILPARARAGGTQAIQLLARSALSARHEVYLVQVGNRVLVLGVTSDRMATLDVISDPEEVAAVLKQAGPAAAPGAIARGFEGLFRRAIREYEKPAGARAAAAGDAELEEPDTEPGPRERRP